MVVVPAVGDGRGHQTDAGEQREEYVTHTIS